MYIQQNNARLICNSKPGCNKCSDNEQHTEIPHSTMAQIVNELGMSLVVTDAKGYVLYANGFAENCADRAEQPRVGMLDPLLDESLIGADNKAIILSSLQTKKRWQFDHKINALSTSATWENVSMSATTDINGGLCNIVIYRNDITDERCSLEQLIYTSRHDRLTKLANKDHALEQLQLKLSTLAATKTQSALFIIDVDNFHMLNEAHGYTAGDNVLKEIAIRLTHELSDTSLIARLSGDKFICVYDNVSELYDVLDKIESVQNMFNREFNFSDRSILLSVCIGVSFSAGCSDAVQLLRDADSAMHHAKTMGKNCYAVFDQQLKQSALRTSQIEFAMRRAITNNEFEVFFQPIVDGGDHQITCAEALLRWHNPDLGFISPTEFIPIAEQSGQLVKIGNWVLQQVCKQVAAWRALGNNTYACVNVSAVQLIEHYQFHATFHSLIKQYGLTAADIELEVTESLMLDNDERHAATLKNLVDANCRFAIDDFGTGFSSLTTLSKFNFHKLKIDKSFIQNVFNSPKDRALTQAIAQIAKTLDMQITAEGVETLQMLEFCQSLGCDFIQGYYFYKPMPAADFYALLKKSH